MTTTKQDGSKDLRYNDQNIKWVTVQCKSCDDIFETIYLAGFD